MEKIKCLICGKEVTNNNSYIGSHVKRSHKITLLEYLIQNYKMEGGFQYEKCGFCDKEAIPFFKADHLKQTYILDYREGYLCKTDECKNNISLLIFKKPYNKKTYEHIGANSQYSSLLHKRSIEDVFYRKSKGSFRSV